MSVIGRRWQVLALVILCFLLAPRLSAAQEPLVWEGTYTVTVQTGGDAPIAAGWETRRYFAAEHEGVTVQGHESRAEISLKAFGQTMTVRESSRSLLTLEHCPVLMEFRSDDGGTQAQEVIATFYPDRVEYIRRAGGEATKGTVEIPEGVSLRDPDVMWDPRAAAVGEETVAWAFQPLSLRLERVKITSRGPDVITIEGREVSAWRIDVDSESLGPATHWVDERGMSLRTDMDFGLFRITITLSSGPPATADDAHARMPDIASSTAVDGGMEIPRPRECRRLVAVVRNLDRESLFVSDQRQRYGPLRVAPDGTLEAELEVATEELPTAPVPIGLGVPEDVARYLEPSSTIESEDARIVAASEEIVGDEPDAWAAVERIGAWVIERMTPSTSVPLLRSAREVFDRPEGECRSYAALFCALARAAGIPCRIVAGAVYVGDSGPPGLERKFGFHAWNEVWVGRWIAVDTALPGPSGIAPVDATHIKFAHGDVADFATAGRVVRSLRLEVLHADTAAPAPDGVDGEAFQQPREEEIQLCRQADW